MSDKEAAARLKCSVSTARRYECWLCEQPMIHVAKGFCGSYMGPKCTLEQIEEKVRRFAEDRKAGT